MSTIYERKVVVRSECEIEEGRTVIAVRLNKESFFVSAKDYRAARQKHPKVNMVSLVSQLKRYTYYTKKELDQIFKNIQYEKFLDIVYDTWKKNSIAAIKKPGFDESRVLYFENDSHQFYPVDSDMPMSRPEHMDYIEGGITNDTYDLDKAWGILSKNPWITELKRIDIPYYNVEANRDKALEFKVLLPQKVWDKLIKNIMKRDPEYWSCHVREHLAYIPWRRTDLLKLKPAYIKPIKEQDDSNSPTEE